MSDFLVALFDGVALGSVYALIALGFTVIYRASQVINFAQGSFLLLAAYGVAWLHVDKGLPFAVAVAVAVVAMALVGALFQVAILRRVVGQQVFTVVMMTIGLNVAVTTVVGALFAGERDLGDPWGLSTIEVGGVALLWVKIWAIIVTLVVLGLFFLADRKTRYGLAMRASAADEEAALAVGIPTRRVSAIAWALAGAVAVIGGVFLAASPAKASPIIGASALRAFPAVILGGLESPTGAVVGGLIIGIVENLTATYQESHAAFLGTNFYLIAPYIVMIAVLMLRPYGLFGSRPAERV